MKKRTHPVIPEAARVIAAFGGPSKLGRVVGRSTSTVSEWGRYGIPEAHERYLRLLNPAAFKRTH